MEHKCSKEKEIDKLTRSIFGNGKKGLTTITQGLCDQMKYLRSSTDDIKADVKVLVQFQTQVETREKERHEFRLELQNLKNDVKIDRKWKTRLIITTIVSLLGVIVTLIIKG